MADKAGELYVTLKMKATDFEKSMKRAQGDVKKLEKNTKQLTKSFGLLRAAAAAAATYGLARLTGSFIEAASASQQYEVRLKVLLRSQKEGTRMFREMSKYAGKVPFEFSKIMESATALAGVMRGGVDEVAAWMPMIGDLAAATGLGVDVATQQVIRMYSAGAGAADLFRDKGVLAMMGFKAKTAYTAEETRKMMMDAWTKANSQFRGATDELAETWAGKMSMMQDAWFAFRNTIMLDTGLMGYFEKLLGYATEFTKGVTADIKQVQQLGLGSAFAGKGEVGLQQFYAGGMQEQSLAPAGKGGTGGAGTAERTKAEIALLKMKTDAFLQAEQLAQEQWHKDITRENEKVELARETQMILDGMTTEGYIHYHDTKWDELRLLTEIENQKTAEAQKEEARREKSKERSLARDKKTTANFMASSLAMAAQHSKKWWRIYQAYRISEAVVDTIQAAQAAYRWGASWGGPIGGAAMAALAAAAGAVRIGMIASEKPSAAEGGILTGPSTGYPATLHGTEAVIPLKGGAVPVSLEGGAGGMGANITFNISTIDETGVREFFERNAGKVAATIADELGPGGNMTLRNAVRSS